MAEAEKKARAREAARKHEEYVERQLRKKQRRAVATKLFGNLIFVLIMLVAVGIALYYGFLLSDIVVLGNDNYPSEYIIERSGLKLGTHMLVVDLDKAEENIAQDPYLQVDSVTYIFPSRVRILVSERKAVAGIVGLDSNVIIDKNGYVLSMAGGTDISDLIQVTGVTVSGFQLGQRLGQGNDFSTATLVQIINVLEQYDLAKSIKSIDLTTPLAITMAAQNGLRIHVGQATELETKMDRARAAAAAVSQQGNCERDALSFRQGRNGIFHNVLCRPGADRNYGRYVRRRVAAGGCGRGRHRRQHGAAVCAAARGRGRGRV